MQKSLLSLAAAVLAFAACNIASAIPITGNIDFAGGAVLDSASLTTATQVSSFFGVTVIDGTGTFSAAGPATPVTFTAPWVFGGAKTGLWSVVLGGFTYTFDLMNSSIMTQNSTFLAVVGTGTISTNNPSFTSSLASWSFSTQNASGGNANSIFSFSATSGTVPDGGTTALLLGAGLVGVGVMARRRKLA